MNNSIYTHVSGNLKRTENERICKKIPSYILFFFILTFLISWSGVLIVASQTGIPATKEQFDKLLLLAMIPYLFGPIIASPSFAVT